LDGNSYTITSVAQDSLTAYASGQGQATSLYHYIQGSKANTTSTNMYFNFMTPAAGGNGNYTVNYISVNNTYGLLFNHSL